MNYPTRQAFSAERGVNCEYLNSKMLAVSEEKACKVENKSSEGKDTYTKKEMFPCECTTDISKNEMIVKKDKINCMLGRITCIEEEWEEVQETDKEMDVYFVLEQWGKVLEGYQRVNKNNKGS